MRLPVVNYGMEVQSLGRRDPMEPVRLASAEARALENASNTMAGISQTLSRRQNDIEYRRNTTRFMTEHLSWVEKNAAKEYYTAEELPADLPFTRTEKVVDEHGNLVEVPRQQIPAYEVYPTLYGKMLNSLVDSFSGTFTNADVEREWIEEARQKAVGAIANAKLNAIEKQRVFGVQQTVSFKDRALDAKKYDLARALVQGNSDLDPNDARAYMDQIDEREETDRYDTLLTNLHEEGLQAALKYLTETDKYDGKLEPHETRSYVAAIRGTLASLQTGRKALAAQQKAELKYDVRNIIEVLKKGERVHPGTLSVAQSRIADVDTNLAKELALSIAYSDVFRTVAVMTPKKQLSYIEEMEAHARSTYSGSTESALLMVWLKEGVAKMQQAIQHDQVKFWNDIADESFPDIDMGNLAKSLIQRKVQARALAKMWDTSVVYLSRAEASEVAEHLSQLPVDQKLAITKEIANGLGEDAYSLYKQLDIKEAGVLTTAGRITAENDMSTAKLLFKAEEYYNSNPSLIAGIKADLNEQIDEALGPAYEAQPQEREQLREAVISLYAYNTRGERQDTVDEGKLSSAISQITGGLAEIGGQLVRVPYRGMEPSAFERWYDRLTPYYIDQAGGVSGYTSEQLIDRAHSGDLTLLHTPTRGEYVFFDQLTGHLVHDKEGKQPFILKYDAMAPINKVIKMGQFVDPIQKETRPISPKFTQQDTLMNMFGGMR